MRIHFPLWSILITLFFISSPAVSDDKRALEPFYISSSVEAVCCNSEISNSAPIIALGLGYHLTEKTSLLAEAHHINDLESDEVNILTLGVRGDVDINENISLYGKLGVSNIHSSGGYFNRNNLNMNSGIGLSFRFNNNTSMVVGYDYFNNLASDNTYYDLGIFKVGLEYKPHNYKNKKISNQNYNYKDSSGVNGMPRKSVNLQYLLGYNKGEYNLNIKNRYTLNKIITSIKSVPSYKIKLIGRADKSGSTKINESISKYRVENVEQYLIKYGNVSNESITKETSATPLINNGYIPSLERSVQIILSFPSVN